MEKSFEEQLVDGLLNVHNEKEIEIMQKKIMDVITEIKSYTQQLNSGRYRNSGYGKLFVTHIKNFTVSIVFGEKNRNNGSGCLIRHKKDFLVTNAHVIRDAIKAPFVLIGKVEVTDLKKRIISINDHLDLAVIDLSNGLNEALEDSGKMFFESKEWPPFTDCKKGDLVYLAGFPGVFREDSEIYSSVYFTAILDQVIEVTDRRLLVQFNRENWVKSLGMKDIEELKRLGGFSGGPVFKFRDDQPELVGFIFEEGGNFFDGVQIIKSNLILSNGEIVN